MCARPDIEWEPQFKAMVNKAINGPPIESDNKEELKPPFVSGQKVICVLNSKNLGGLTVGEEYTIWRCLKDSMMSSGFKCELKEKMVGQMYCASLFKAKSESGKLSNDEPPFQVGDHVEMLKERDQKPTGVASLVVTGVRSPEQMAGHWTLPGVKANEGEWFVSCDPKCTAWGPAGYFRKAFLPPFAVGEEVLANYNFWSDLNTLASAIQIHENKPYRIRAIQKEVDCNSGWKVWVEGQQGGCDASKFRKMDSIGEQIRKSLEGTYRNAQELIDFEVGHEAAIARTNYFAYHGPFESGDLRWGQVNIGERRRWLNAAKAVEAIVKDCDEFRIANSIEELIQQNSGPEDLNLEAGVNKLELALQWVKDRIVHEKAKIAPQPFQVGEVVQAVENVMSGNGKGTVAAGCHIKVSACERRNPDICPSGWIVYAEDCDHWGGFDSAKFKKDPIVNPVSTDQWKLPNSGTVKFSPIINPKPGQIPIYRGDGQVEWIDLPKDQTRSIAWEYRVTPCLDVIDEGFDSGVVDRLNNSGEIGWEFVAFTPMTGRAVFKRRK